MLRLETAACSCEQHVDPDTMLHRLWVCSLCGHGCLCNFAACGTCSVGRRAAQWLTCWPAWLCSRPSRVTCFCCECALRVSTCQSAARQRHGLQRPVW